MAAGAAADAVRANSTENCPRPPAGLPLLLPEHAALLVLLVAQTVELAPLAVLLPLPLPVALVLVRGAE